MNIIEYLVKDNIEDDTIVDIGHICCPPYSNKDEYLQLAPNNKPINGFWILPEDMVICYNNTIVAAFDELNFYLISGEDVPYFKAMPFANPIPITDWIANNGRDTYYPTESPYPYIGDFSNLEWS